MTLYALCFSGAQWLSLRRYVRDSWLFVAATVIGVAVMAALLRSMQLTQYTSFLPPLSIAFLVPMVPWFINGVALVMLIRQLGRKKHGAFTQ